VQLPAQDWAAPVVEEAVAAVRLAKVVRVEPLVLPSPARQDLTDLLDPVLRPQMLALVVEGVAVVVTATSQVVRAEPVRPVLMVSSSFNTGSRSIE
jgi:hypothetical protein